MVAYFNKEYATTELKRDLLYEKIPEEDREKISDNAWQTGVRVAHEHLQKRSYRSAEEWIQAEQITLECVDVDQILGDIRYYSVYIPDELKIFLYTHSVQKWAIDHSLTEKDAKSIILAHELYHHLEYTELEEAAKQYMVPRIKIGTLQLGKSSVQALSEIAAHGFAYACYKYWKQQPDVSNE